VKPAHEAGFVHCCCRKPPTETRLPLRPTPGPLRSVYSRDEVFTLVFGNGLYLEFRSVQQRDDFACHAVASLGDEVHRRQIVGVTLVIAFDHPISKDK
jgi:hypothetical protein